MCGILHEGVLIYLICIFTNKLFVEV